MSRELVALASVARKVLGTQARLPAAATSALALLERVARDEKVAASELRRAAAGATAGDRPLVLVGMARLCELARTGSTDVGEIQSALSQLAIATGKPVWGWYEKALATGAPPADPTIARVAKLLGKHGRLLAKHGARFDPRRTCTRAALVALLARNRYPAHPAVLAFEAAFGGLLIPEPAPASDWFTAGEAILVGACACLRSKAHKAPGRDVGLVPVVYTMDDGVAYLDRGGRMWFEDTIEDLAPRVVAKTGVAGFARLLATI